MNHLSLSDIYQASPAEFAFKMVAGIIKGIYIANQDS